MASDYVTTAPCFDQDLLVACDAQDEGGKPLNRAQKRRANRIIELAKKQLRKSRPAHIKPEPPSQPLAEDDQ